MNKFSQQKEHREPILFTELLKEIPTDDVLLALFHNDDRPGHPLVTRRGLEVLKLHLKGTQRKAIAAMLDITPGQVSRC